MVFPGLDDRDPRPDRLRRRPEAPGRRGSFDLVADCSAELHGRTPLAGALGLALGVLQLATDDPHGITGALLVLMLATTGDIVTAALVRPDGPGR